MDFEAMVRCLQNHSYDLIRHVREDALLFFFLLLVVHRQRSRTFRLCLSTRLYPHDSLPTEVLRMRVGPLKKKTLESKITPSNVVYGRVGASARKRDVKL